MPFDGAEWQYEPQREPDVPPLPFWLVWIAWITGALLELVWFAVLSVAACCGVAWWFGGQFWW